MSYTIPRRNRLDLMVPAEISIHKIMNEVEEMGADEKLTEAVVLLAKAKNLVSDYVDSKVIKTIY